MGCDMRKTGLLLIFLILLDLTGCMTIMNQVAYFDSEDEDMAKYFGEWGTNYAGTRDNLTLFFTPNPITIAYLDLPMCLVMDTVILPLTLWQTRSISQIIREQENEAPQEEVTSEQEED